MMRHIVSSAFGLWVGCSAALAETEQGVVVELFTSQGCSSCPPADALMGQLADMPGVIGLSLHVDYWDYIGWPDTFASPQYSERQRAYAQAAGDHMIYTPQMIVAGGHRVEGSQPGEVAAAIAQAAARRAPVRLDLQQSGDALDITGESAVDLPAGTTVQLVRYRKMAAVDIGRGENAGLSVEYHNIVTSWQKIGEWTGAEPLHLQARLDGDEPAVVIVQAAGPAEILAAARLK